MKKKSSSVKRKNLKNSIFSPQIRNKRIKEIYKRFEFLIKQEEFKGYLVAVSGGADSLASVSYTHLTLPTKSGV